MRISIPEYFVFIFQVETQGQQYFSLGFHPAGHSIFDTRYRDWRNIGSTGKFGFADQQRLANLLQTISAHLRNLSVFFLVAKKNVSKNFTRREKMVDTFPRKKIPLSF
jgi:hypothetical protein